MQMSGIRRTFVFTRTRDIMHQIAFTVFSHPIHWYGVCIAAGFLLATGLMLCLRRYAGMSRDNVFDIAMLSIFSGIIGARVFFVIQFWDKEFAGRPFSAVFRVDKGGIVFYGGFIAAFAVLCIYALRKKLSIRLILDLAAPAIALGHAFGRLGCFMQGCCFGRCAPDNFPGAVRFPAGSMPFHRYPGPDGLHSLPLYPVQLYECVLNLLLSALLVFLLRRNRKPGRIAAIYLIGYAAIRFTIEFFRGDHTDSFLNMTPSQNIALFVMLPLGILVYFLFPRGQVPAPAEKSGPDSEPVSRPKKKKRKGRG